MKRKRSVSKILAVLLSLVVVITEIPADVFAAENATPAYCTKYFSSNSLTYGGLYPTFLIAFRCNAGLEEYWTYHEQSVNGGMGYINVDDTELLLVTKNRSLIFGMK